MSGFDLGAAVSRHDWEWLFDFGQRFDVAIEIIDPQYVPVLPVGAGRTAGAVRRLLMTAEPYLRSVISNATQSNVSPEAAVEGQACVCFGLAPTGVLLVARDLTACDSAEECCHDLEMIGSWLRRAIEANLASTSHDAGVEQYRIASLRRLLNEAVSRGSARNLVGAFVEALGVWDGIDVRAYVAVDHGRWFQHTAPVGADPSAVPRELDDDALPGNTAIVRLSRLESNRLGFVLMTDDVLMKRIATESGACWLMVFSGIIDPEEEVRLRLFSDMLRESLNDLTVAATNRVVAAITQRQVSADEPVEKAAQSLLGEITAAVRARDAGLVLTTTRGIQALTVGNTDLLPATAAHSPPPDRLMVTSSDEGSLMALVVTRGEDRFTSHEREVLEAAVEALHPWVRGALQRSGKEERRRRFPSVAELFDQLAIDTVQAGGEASVMVISICDTALRPGVLQAWLATIRRQLRPTDFAGILSLSEIAVLLSDTPADRALPVSARLKKLLESDESAGVFIQPAVGMMTSSPESPFEGSLVGAARAEAAGRSQ